MATIGGVTVDVMKGRQSPLKKRVEIWEVPGIDGFGAQTFASGQSSFSYELTDFGSEANVNTFIAAIAALQGTIVTIVDDHAVTTTNALVRRVSPARKLAEPINGGKMVTMRITGVILQ